MDVMEARRRLLMQKKSRLPSEYQEVEWVKGSNVRIGLNYTIKSSPKVITKMAINAYGDRDVMGFSNNVIPSFIINPDMGSGGTTWYNRYYNTGRYSFAFNPTKDIPNVYEFGPSVYVDGILITTIGIYYSDSSYLDWSSNTQEFYLFGARTFSMGVTFYSFTLFDGDDLVRDLVPCYRKEDSIIGMYDLISKAFLTYGSATGTWEKGQNV